jgi:hypothetical protein
MSFIQITNSYILKQALIIDISSLLACQGEHHKDYGASADTVKKDTTAHYNPAAPC